MARSFYERLNVQPTASAEEIETAYQRLGSKFHPDNPRTGAAKEFNKVQEAYYVLADATRRREYDRRNSRTRSFSFFGAAKEDGEAQKSSAGVSEAPSWSGSGSGSGSSEPVVAVGVLQGNDFVVPLKLTLEELFAGCTKTRVVRRRPAIPGAPPDDTSVSITVEPGYKAGTKLRYRGLGDYIDGGTAGLRRDVVFEIVERPHARFVRAGDALEMEVEISLREALLGFERPVVGVDGRALSVAHARPVDPAAPLQLRGQGMPCRRGGAHSSGERGPLTVRARVVLPKTLTKAQRGVFLDLFPET